MEDTGELARDESGNPVLEQLSADGFVDMVFRVERMNVDDQRYALKLRASSAGEVVGLDAIVLKGMEPGLTKELEVAHVYRGGVQLLRSGPESDRLLTRLAALYGLGDGPLAIVEREALTAIALQEDPFDLEKDAVKLKLFGRDSDADSDDDYYESFLHLDLAHDLAFWNEKDFDYRAPLLRALSRAAH